MARNTQSTHSENIIQNDNKYELGKGHFIKEHMWLEYFIPIYR